MEPTASTQKSEKSLKIVRDSGYPQMQQENLLSFIIISSGNIALDVAEIENISAFAKDNFSYYELLIFATIPKAGWLAEMNNLGTNTANFRIITSDILMGYEELASTSLRHAIGDYVVSVYPGEIDITELQQLLARLASGQFNIVKAVHATGASSILESASAAIIGKMIQVTTGQTIEAFQARAFGMSRAAVSRVQTMGERLKFFRILNVSNHFSQGQIEIPEPPRRRFLGAFGEKLRLAADLVAMSSSRLIRTLAFVCAVLALVSIGVTGLSFLIWVFMTDIAPGWTSLSMIFSFLFAANFGVLAAICLGILQSIRQNAPDEYDIFTSEISGGDFFYRGEKLNVEDQQETGS